jgi:hypothetical protein
VVALTRMPESLPSFLCVSTQSNRAYLHHGRTSRSRERVLDGRGRLHEPLHILGWRAHRTMPVGTTVPFGHSMLMMLLVLRSKTQTLGCHIEAKTCHLTYHCKVPGTRGRVVTPFLVKSWSMLYRSCEYTLISRTLRIAVGWAVLPLSREDQECCLVNNNVSWLTGYSGKVARIDVQAGE